MTLIIAIMAEGIVVVLLVELWKMLKERNEARDVYFFTLPIAGT